MGRVIFREDQPIQELRGTYGKVTFRVINGKTVAHTKPQRRQARSDEFDKADIIDQCVADIQLQMHDMREAIADRQAIIKRIDRLYDKYRNRCKDETELIKHIRIAYLGNRRKRPADAKKGVQYAIKFGKPP